MSGQRSGRKVPYKRAGMVGASFPARWQHDHVRGETGVTRLQSTRRRRKDLADDRERTRKTLKHRVDREDRERMENTCRYLVLLTHTLLRFPSLGEQIRVSLASSFDLPLSHLSFSLFLSLLHAHVPLPSTYSTRSRPSRTLGAPAPFVFATHIT